MQDNSGGGGVDGWKEWHCIEQYVSGKVHDCAADTILSPRSLAKATKVKGHFGAEERASGEGSERIGY